MANLVTSDGAGLDLVECGGDLYRPVLAPGSWAPVDAATFGRAVGGGEPWGDNPFHAAMPGGFRRLHVDDHASLAARRSDCPDARAQARSSWEAIEARLALVDGVVHRRTRAPVLGLVARGALRTSSMAHPHAWAMSGAWRFDDGLSSWSDQSVSLVPDQHVKRLLAPFPAGVPLVQPWRIERALTVLAEAFDGVPVIGVNPSPPAACVAPDLEAEPVDPTLMRWSDAGWRNMLDRWQYLHLRKSIGGGAGQGGRTGAAPTRHR